MPRGAVTVSGEVLGVDFKQGNQGTDKAYAFHILSLLSGKTVTEVKWDGRNMHDAPIPKEGDFLSVEVELSVWSGRLQVNAQRLTPVLAAAKTG